MNHILNDLWQFGKAHWGVFTLGAAWCVREWATVRGWNGLKYYFFNGVLPPKKAEPSSAPPPN